MQGNAEFGKYILDNCDPLKLTRNFLLTLIAYIDPNLYKDIFAEYKIEIQRRKYSKWGDYNVIATNELINDIWGFVQVANEANFQGGFRIIKKIYLLEFLSNLEISIKINLINNNMN